MQPSIFNLRVPIEGGTNVFLMNTLTDAQLVVSADVAALLDRVEVWESDLAARAGAAECEAIGLLREQGFLVTDRATDRRSLDLYLSAVKTSTDELHITLLTTLQCNFACVYCYQGDRGDHNRFAETMTPETAARVADWIERELDRVRPERLAITFFGGEPLLNLPVLYDLSDRLWAEAQVRGIRMTSSIITNGLLLTPKVVDRLLPRGLEGVKITLDGDRDAHNRARPLRGGQGTFDRIVENVRSVAARVPVSIGGNFDESSADSYPALLDFLRKQDFAGKLARVNFKPVIRTHPASATAGATPKGVLPVTPANGDGTRLGGACMTGLGEGGDRSGTACDACGALDDEWTFLRDETTRHGFPTPDGVHMGPCHVHFRNAHTIGPDGSLYACPGFTGELAASIGHVDGRRDAWRETAREKFDHLDPWKECGDCAFLPVCAGGCVAASHSQLGDMNLPTCHKRSFESALVSLAHTAASAAA